MVVHPSVSYKPALQAQFVTDVDPREEEEEPVGHAVHALTPAAAEYVPPGHKTQTLALLAPTTPEYFPAPQPTQTPEPVTVLYSPAAHGVHLLLSAAETKPAIVMPLMTAPLQSAHLLAALPPLVDRYLPAVH